MEGFDHSALDALAVFPLPDVVLFPGTLLPLHIFEPRYRDMIADVLAGSRVLAVARLRPGYEKDYEGRPPIFGVAGVGYVVQSDKLPDGRYNIMLRGVGRVRVEEELAPAHSYREVRARMLVDTRSTRAGEEIASAQEQLIAICDQLAERVPEGGASLRQLARTLPSPGGCADAVASALLRDPGDRQDLLELLDPADRLERMISHTAALLVRLSTGSRLPN
jgi:Lon protease-like protein